MCRISRYAEKAFKEQEREAPQYLDPMGHTADAVQPGDPEFERLSKPSDEPVKVTELCDHF